MTGLRNLWSDFLIHILDILLVAYIFYRLLLLLKGTRAIRILIGIVILGVITIISKDVLKLRVLTWILENFWLPGVIIIAIMFQPELRNLLLQVGNTALAKRFPLASLEYVSEVVDAVKELSVKKNGALIVIERSIGLKDYIQTGTMIDGKISKELILNIFQPNSPLHDGAVIIQRDRIVSAGSTLPFTEKDLPKKYGMRHKAALGVSEVSDAIAVVVSGETGKISIASNSALDEVKDSSELKLCLYQLLRK